MKDLSPFLPDSPTLSSLFAGAGIACDEPPWQGRAGQPRMAPSDSAGAAPKARIRFLATPPLPGGAARPASNPPDATPAPLAAPPAKGLVRASNASPAAAAARPPRDDADLDADAIRHIFGGSAGAQARPPLQQRIEAFVDWLCTGAGAVASFVADADGLVLANRDDAEAYAAATASISHNEEAAFRGTPLPVERTTVIELDDSKFLQVIRVDTNAGRLAVGVVGAEPLSRARCAQVRRLLRLGVEGEASA
ncbi:MAG: hypothetical protein IPI49_32785 [Myxococcales bacterium]|nr:hypothetical protein [Myxococcales bacterium]